MSKKPLIEEAVESLEQLSEQKIIEATTFIRFLLERRDEQLLQKGAEKLMGESELFNRFFEDEPDLYSEDDLKERF